MIGITGGIGSGKSVVSRILRLRGCSVYDCDLRARELMERDEELKQELAEHFGEDAISSDGTINRAYIAERVFGNDTERLWLNTLVHGRVREDILREQPQFVESAIMKSSGLDAMCSEIWLVTADEETRLDRVAKRDGVEREHCRRRMEAQQGEYEFGKEIKVVTITNDGKTSLLEQMHQDRSR